MKQFIESSDLLRTIASQTEDINREAQKLVEGLNTEQLNWKPAPGSWSIAQCLEHLAVTSEREESYLVGAIARGREKGSVNGPLTYQPTLFGGWIIRRLLPTTTRKMPAPKVYRPAASSNIEGSLERFLEQQAKLLIFLNNSEGLDFNKIRFRSAVTPFIRFSLADNFVMTVVHSQRHLAQARRVRETPGFPK